MPLRQYTVLKKAVEIESIASRKTYLQDTNRAFHDPKPLMNQLNKEQLSLLHKYKDDAQINNVNWGKDSDWKSKLKKFQI